MRCSNCGHEIPKGTLYCRKCGEEIRIVPDYNPLDDMLTAQIKVSINDHPSRNGNPGNNERATSAGRTGNTQSKLTPEERAARRRQAERRREIKRKKRRCLIIVMAFIFLLLIGLGILLYRTSYTGTVKRGNKAFVSAEYVVAQECFEKAIGKKPDQPDAYIGLSKIYISKNNFEKAELLFLDAIENYPDKISIYEACIQFYQDTEQRFKIPVLLSEANSNVKDKLSDYIVKKPEYSLNPSQVYDEVQQISLISNEETIYYTVDGTDPDFNSLKYSEPIQLDEGQTTIKAFAVNKKGIPGPYEVKTYVIELPIEDAPAISPSTGQYNKPMKIEIKVPEGYTAYYTMDGTTPTTASQKYSGPIDMPQKDTLFKAVLVNAHGRTSGVTTRNYILEMPEEE